MADRRGLAFVSARSKGRRAAWALRAFATVQIAVLTISAFHLVLLGLWWGGISVPETAFILYDVGRISLGYIGMLLMLVIALLFLLWFQWVYRNLYSLGARKLEYSTSWAVGGFFVPIGNILFPYIVAKEVWANSDPDHGLGVSAPVPGRLRWWWISFLATGVGDYFVMRYDEQMGGSLREWVTFILLDMGTAVVAISAAYFARWLIEEIDTRQEERHLRMATMADVGT